MPSKILSSAYRLVTGFIGSGTQMTGAWFRWTGRSFIILLGISGVISLVSGKTVLMAQAINPAAQTYIWKDGNARIPIPSSWSIKEQINDGNAILEASSPDNNPPASITRFFICHKAELGTVPSIWNIQKANLTLEVFGYEGNETDRPGEYKVTEIIGTGRINGVKAAVYEYLYEDYVRQEAWLAIAISRSPGSEDELDILLSDPEVNNIARGIRPLK